MTQKLIPFSVSVFIVMQKAPYCCAAVLVLLLPGVSAICVSWCTAGWSEEASCMRLSPGWSTS